MKTAKTCEWGRACKNTPTVQIVVDALGDDGSTPVCGECYPDAKKEADKNAERVKDGGPWSRGDKYEFGY